MIIPKAVERRSIMTIVALVCLKFTYHARKGKHVHVPGLGGIKQPTPPCLHGQTVLRPTRNIDQALLSRKTLFMLTDTP